MQAGWLVCVTEDGEEGMDFGERGLISMVAIEAGKERWKTMEWNGMKPPCVWLALLGIIDASPPQSLCQSAAQYNSSSKSTLIAHLMIHSNTWWFIRAN